MRSLAVGAAVGGLACLVLVSSCAGRDETEGVRRLIRKGAGLAERHDVRGLMELTSEGFLAQPGNRDRPQVSGILWMAFRRYRDFRVLYPAPAIDLQRDGEAASATVYFLIVRREQSYPGLKDLYGDPHGWLEEVGDNADLYRLELDLTRTGGDWLTTGARLEPFKGYGFGKDP